MSIELPQIHVFRDCDIHSLDDMMSRKELEFKIGDQNSYELFYNEKIVVFETEKTEISIKPPWDGETSFKKKRDNDVQVEVVSQSAGILAKQLDVVVEKLRKVVAPSCTSTVIYALAKNKPQLSLKWVEEEFNQNLATTDRHFINGTADLIVEAQAAFKTNPLWLNDKGTAALSRSLLHILKGQTKTGVVRYRPVVWCFKGARMICGLRICSMDLCEACDVGETHLEGLTADSISNNGANIFFDGKLRLRISDVLRIKAFESENDYVSSVVSSFSDTTYNSLESIFALTNVNNDPAFTVCLKKDEKYGNQLKIKRLRTSMLPQPLSPGSCLSADGIVVMIQTYDFTDKLQVHRCGVNCDLKVIYGACDAASATASSNFGLSDMFNIIPTLNYEVGSNEGNYFPFSEGNMLKLNLCFSDTGGVQLSTISNPQPDPSYSREDGLRDVFWIPDPSQFTNLKILEEKARDFMNSEYQKYYKVDAPWRELDMERIKIKINRPDLEVETIGGEKHKILDVVTHHTSFVASVTVIPRIWAPHLMQKEIQKGAKRALRDPKQAMFSFQLTNMLAKVVMQPKLDLIPDDADGGIDVSDAM